MKNLLPLFYFLWIFLVTGCSFFKISSDGDGLLEVERNITLSNFERFSKKNIFDYSYLESKTGLYNSDKLAAIKLKNKETKFAVQKFNQIKDIKYQQSPEELLESTAMSAVNEKNWQIAFDILINYEPILTYNKNMTNMTVLCSFKLNKYQFAIQQLQLSLSLPDENLLDEKTRTDRLEMLAHAYLLANQKQSAKDIYSEILQKENSELVEKIVEALETKTDDNERFIASERSDILNTVNLAVDQYANKYIYSDYSKDSVVVREEFKPVTNPIPARLPASLEFKK